MIAVYLIGLSMIFIAEHEVGALLGYFIVHVGAAVNIAALIIIYSSSQEKLKKSEVLQLTLCSLPILALVAFKAIFVKS